MKGASCVWVAARWFSAAALVVAFSGMGQITLAQSAKSMGVGHGGLGFSKVWDSHHDCVPLAKRAEIRQRAHANRLLLPPADDEGGISGSAPPFVMPFYPMAGTIDADVYHLNFVDLDPLSPGVLDFACTPFTYDGHNGIDTPLRSFTEQAIGVPVFAALDGVVIDRHDGEPDMNTVPLGQDPNFVLIDHGFGYETFYVHLKNGSVSVNVGDYVRAGEQIGMAASSGNSSGPHLHFTTNYLFQSVEPFAGACRPGPSLWLNQEAGILTSRLLDFGITSTNLNSVPGLPFPQPAHGQIALSDGPIFYWMSYINLTPNSTWRFRFLRPNSTVAYDSGTVGFNNAETWRGGWFWFNWDITDMHTIAGLWHVEVSFNGQVMVNAPINVVATVDPSFNRAPENITASFDSGTTTTARPIIARVGGPVVLDDLDFDVVRYHYVWRVNGNVVRDVTTAARSDVLARGIAQVGDTVSCTITPSDGTLNGNPASTSAVVTGTPPPPGTCVADIAPPGGNDMVNVDDLLKVINSWGSCP